MRPYRLSRCRGSCSNAAQEIIRSENLNYTETYGLAKLREALAEKHDLVWGKEGVTISTGTSEALFCTLAAIIDPGDELLVPGLTLRAHKNTAHFFSGNVREYPLSMDSPSSDPGGRTDQVCWFRHKSNIG
ncbi:MAG: aminotransferase class I/II-fold pyridoxal phosphate-dependent enzyme [Candidatus Marinimicrobia bacterium]|nr:aminotransferase class I/II-fold pyridoxal phosphate-dependent enzyme [Candidatus Neomarinimicrobiota bacterium]